MAPCPPSRRSVPCLLLLVAALIGAAASARAGRDMKEPKDRYAIWLSEVAYLITPDEKKDWALLARDTDRERFIKRFWELRTPEGADPEDVRVEHYRRIEYANQRFSAGYLGSRTDRGRIYITLGPPTTITRVPAGLRREVGTVDTDSRALHGDALRQTGQDKPLEIWTYRHLPGPLNVSMDLQFVFIDRYFSGNYEMIFDSGDWDLMAALEADPTLVPNSGSPFSPIMQGFDLVNLQRELRREIEKRRDVSTTVTASTAFSTLPVKLEQSYFRGEGGKTYTALVASIPGAEVGSTPEGDGSLVTLNLEARVRNPEGALAARFGDTARLLLDAEDWRNRAHLTHQIHAAVQLDPGSYEMEAVVYDRAGSRVGVVRSPLNVPTFAGSGPRMSSLLLATGFEPVSQRTTQVDLGRLAGTLEHARVEVTTVDPDSRGPFVFGATRIVPLGGQPLEPGEPLGVYFQLYAPGLKPECRCPEVEVRYALIQGDRPVRALGEPKLLDKPVSGSEPMLSAGRLLDTSGLAPGRYTIRVEAEDRVAGVTRHGEAPLVIRQPAGPEAAQRSQ